MLLSVVVLFNATLSIYIITVSNKINNIILSRSHLVGKLLNNNSSAFFLNDVFVSIVIAV